MLKLGEDEVAFLYIVPGVCCGEDGDAGPRGGLNGAEEWGLLPPKGAKTPTEGTAFLTPEVCRMMFLEDGDEPVCSRSRCWAVRSGGDSERAPKAPPTPRFPVAVAAAAEAAAAPAPPPPPAQPPAPVAAAPPPQQPPWSSTVSQTWARTVCPHGNLHSTKPRLHVSMQIAQSPCKHTSPSTISDGGTQEREGNIAGGDPSGC